MSPVKASIAAVVCGLAIGVIPATASATPAPPTPAPVAPAPASTTTTSAPATPVVPADTREHKGTDAKQQEQPIVVAPPAPALQAGPPAQPAPPAEPPVVVPVAPVNDPAPPPGGGVTVPCAPTTVEVVGHPKLGDTQLGVKATFLNDTGMSACVVTIGGPGGALVEQRATVQALEEGQTYQVSPLTAGSYAVTVGGVQITFAVASDTSSPTVTRKVRWLLPEGAEVVNNVTTSYPQRLMRDGEELPCGRIAQVDTMVGTQREIDDVLADGWLKPGEDAKLTKKWTFEYGATCAPPPEDKKINICHATSSTTNPFVAIEVALKALREGHGKHDGDIIPPNEVVTAGLNWTPENQAIHRNGCNKPVNPPVDPPPVDPPPVVTPPVDTRKVATPVRPTQSDTCEPAGEGQISGDYYMVPKIDGVEYRADQPEALVPGSKHYTFGKKEVRVTATPAAGYKFAGEQSVVYALTFPNNNACQTEPGPIPTPPTTPTVPVPTPTVTPSTPVPSVPVNPAPRDLPRRPAPAPQDQDNGNKVVPNSGAPDTGYHGTLGTDQNLPVWALVGVGALALTGLGAVARRRIVVIRHR